MPRLVCNICAHTCSLAEDETGRCSVRANWMGQVRHLGGNRLGVLHRDPIERKPFYHFLPKTHTLSVGMVGCNMSCQFCLNAPLSQFERSKLPVSTWGKEVSVELLVKTACQSQCQSISFTYTEPILYLEYILEVAEKAVEAAVPITLVTNGYFTPETCKLLVGKVAALNIDLKSFSDDYYQKVCGAHLQPVLNAIEYFVSNGVHVEISTPLITGLNDDPKELESMARFLKSIDPDIAWHLIRVLPAYKYANIQTTDDSLQRASEIGLAAGLKYIYVDNTPSKGSENLLRPHPSDSISQSQSPKNSHMAAPIPIETSMMADMEPGVREIYTAFPNGVSAGIDGLCCLPDLQILDKPTEDKDGMMIVSLETDGQLVLTSSSSDLKKLDAILEGLEIPQLDTRITLCG